MKASAQTHDQFERPTSVGHDLARHTVAVVLAGGEGTRLDPLTRNVCKPALPFGGTYRCIDFSLSNCVNSGVRTIGVATRYKPDALLAHLWTHWNADAAGDELVVHAWRAEERARRCGACGTADAVYRNLGSICRSHDSLVLVLAGDHVYKMDYRPMLETHRARNAAVTIACIEAPIEDMLEFGVLSVGADGCVERLVEKPPYPSVVHRATGDKALASMGIYVFDAAFLRRVLAADAEQPASGHDFAADILPRLIEGGRVCSYAVRGVRETTRAYWRDIGTLRTYWSAHMELLGPAPLFTFDDPVWPIGRAAAPPRIVFSRVTTAEGGSIEDSIVPASCNVAGTVLNSVLSDDVVVARDARVTGTVVLPGAVIAAGSRLRGVIVDAGQRVAANTVIESCEPSGPPPVLSQHHLTAGGARDERSIELD
jgi:glucose-1-phosphate adenylyltransferase